jgi:hypothetical protein
VISKLFREPLVHFLLLGAALFGAYYWMSGPDAERDDRITVTQAKIESLAVGFTRTWQRPPTAAELEGLIRDYVREEIAAREALAMGLDKDDTIIRRRLRQKLEFVAEDLSTLAEPTEDDLHAFLTAHPDKFGVHRRYTFRVEPQADLVMLQRDFDGVTAQHAAKHLGNNFASKLDQLRIGQWQGPIESGYGPCQVIVTARTEGRAPALDEVRDDVRREWASARRSEAAEKFYRVLLERYDVTIEQPQAGGTHVLAEAKP